VSVDGFSRSSTAAIAHSELEVDIEPGERQTVMLALRVAGVGLRCGDGVISGIESCDDGNDKTDDGCDRACALEPGFACVGQPSRCAETCGDSVRDANEACDDGDREPADGCSPNCVVDSGWSCSGEPSMCSPVSTCAAACHGCRINECCGEDCGTGGGDCNLKCPGGCDCNLNCSGSSNCKPECKGGGSCIFDCAGASNCAPDCKGMGTACEISCGGGASNCNEVLCGGGAACVLFCLGTANCGFRDCPGGAMSCGDDVHVCNRDCP
jgi:cysteine-rich repeat protein